MSYSDEQTTIQNLKCLVIKFCKERNWLEYHKPRNLSISICLEAAELLELFQWDDRNDEASLKTDNMYQRLKDELADIVVYCLQMANTMNIDLSGSIAEKMEKNAVKYPVK
jgi:NTP pyrophosphatase (non-canonical NTP hydrolase)